MYDEHGPRWDLGSRPEWQPNVRGFTLAVPAVGKTRAKSRRGRALAGMIRERIEAHSKARTPRARGLVDMILKDVSRRRGL